jgi:arylsulfatase A-like enzyme
MRKQPHILLIMSDQQRWDSLGCNGADWVSTPHLDQLAAQGSLFANCYANNPICTPARASLMTGHELPGHGVYQLHDVLPAQLHDRALWKAARQRPHRGGAAAPSAGRL